MPHEDNSALRELRREYKESKRLEVRERLTEPLLRLYDAIVNAYDTTAKRLFKLGLVVVLASVAAALLAILLTMHGVGDSFYVMHAGDVIAAFLIAGAVGAGVAAYLMFKWTDETRRQMRQSLLPGPPIRVVDLLEEVVAAKTAVSAVAEESRKDTEFAREYVETMRSVRTTQAEARADLAQRMADNAVIISSVADAERELIRRMEDEIVSSKPNTPMLNRKQKILACTKIAPPALFVELRGDSPLRLDTMEPRRSDAWGVTYAVFEVANCVGCKKVVRTSTEVHVRSSPVDLGVEVHAFDSLPELGIPHLYWPDGGLIRGRVGIVDPVPPYGVWYCALCSPVSGLAMCPPDACERGTIKVELSVVAP